MTFGWFLLRSTHPRKLLHLCRSGFSRDGGRHRGESRSYKTQTFRKKYTSRGQLRISHNNISSSDFGAETTRLFMFSIVQEYMDQLDSASEYEV